MSRYHGITDGTYERFVIDSGAVYKNYVDGSNPGVLLGATRGGNTFTVEQEIKDMAVDGARGPVKGGRRITNVVPRIVANFIEFSREIIIRALPGSDYADYPEGSATHDQITRALQISTGDHCTNIAIVGEVSGSSQPIVCIVNNPICDGNFGISETDKEEAALQVQFTGHFDPSDLDTEPWEIRWPQGIDLTTTTTAGA
jgi:hypothetical protein